MRRGTTRFIVSALLMGLALLATACGDSEPEEPATGNAGAEESPSAEPVTVTVGYVPYVGAAPFKLGIDNGFFEEQGITIEDSEGVAPAPIMAQVVSGQLDIGFTTVPALVAAAANGLELQIISAFDGLVDPENPSSAIMVMEDSPIQAPKDLVGKKVGVVALQSGLDVVTHEVVRRDGGDHTKVESVQIPFPEMTTALKAGRVDAVANTEPFVTLATEEGVRSISYPEVEVIPNGTLTAFVASREFIESQPDTVSRFQAAMKKSLEYAGKHPDEAKAVMPEIADIEPDVLEKINLGTIFEPGIDPASVEAFVDIQSGLGFVENPPAPSDLVADGAE